MALTIIKEIAPRVYSGKKQRRYFTRCHCGNEYEISGPNLRSGKITHCGCDSPRHGEHGTSLYNRWRRMMQCCYNKNYQAYHNYGGRGITVCKDWHIARNFFEWAKSNGYQDKLTLERVDVNGDYCPENCTWATTKQQSRNKRSTRRVRYGSKVMCLADYAKEVGLKYTTAMYRLNAGKLEEVVGG